MLQKSIKSFITVALFERKKKSTNMTIKEITCYSLTSVHEYNNKVVPHKVN